MRAQKGDQTTRVDVWPLHLKIANGGRSPPLHARQGVADGGIFRRCFVLAILSSAAGYRPVLIPLFGLLSLEENMRHTSSWLVAAATTAMVVTAPFAGIAHADEAQPGTAPVTTQGADDTPDASESVVTTTAQPGTTTTATPGAERDDDSEVTTTAQPGTTTPATPADEVTVEDVTPVTGTAQPGTETVTPEPVSESETETDAEPQQEQPTGEQVGATETAVAPATAADGGENVTADVVEPVDTEVAAAQPMPEPVEPQVQATVPATEKTPEVQAASTPVVLAPKGAITGVQVRGNLGEQHFAAVHDVASATTTVRADGAVSGAITVSRERDGLTLSHQDQKITVVPEAVLRANDAVGAAIAAATPAEVHAVREAALAHVPTDASVAVDGNEIAAHVDRV